MARGWQELARAAAAAAMAAGVITTTAAARAPSGVPAQVAVAPTTITAITGAQIEVAGSSMVVTRPGASHGLLELAVGGQRYLIPAAAVPYLGRVLDISLFRLTALAAAERDGRFPLTITYSGRLPVLPGVRVTAAGAGRASGYLTAASATRFAAALAHRQLAANVRVSLAGTAPAAAQRPSPQYRMHMLTVAGTSITGKPDNGDSVYVGDVSNGNALGSGPGTLSQFYKGTAKFSVPAGTYWAVGLFADPDGSFRLTVVPQFTVSGDTTVEVDERTATSKLSITTPKASTFAVGTLDPRSQPWAGWESSRTPQ